MKAKGLTLKQELSLAKGYTLLSKRQGKINLAMGMTSKKDPSLNRSVYHPPHPYKDLTLEQKQKKVVEMYDNGEGFWGIGPVAFRRLAKLFGIPLGQVVVWCEE